MLILDDGRLGGRVALSGVRGTPPLAGMLLENADGVRRAVRFNFGGEARGDSGRGRDGRLNLGLFTERGPGPAPGPTDLLKGGLEGVGGVLPIDAVRLETYLLLFIGTKMPEPGCDVVK